MIHLVLLMLVFYSWKKMPSFEEEKIQENISVKLCCVVEKKPEVKVMQKPTPLRKEEIKKVVPKEVVKKVIVIKKEVPQLVAPVVKEKVELVLEQKKEEVQEAVKESQATEAESDQKEIPHAKEVTIAQEYVNEHIKRLVRLLQENLYYPRSARKRGIEGSVTVRFVLKKDATVDSIEVLSSNSEILSRAAVQTIENLSGKFPRPKEELVLNVPIKYDLKR